MTTGESNTAPKSSISSNSHFSITWALCLMTGRVDIKNNFISTVCISLQHFREMDTMDLVKYRLKRRDFLLIVYLNCIM